MEYVWVFGASAVGKRTFIRNIINNDKSIGDIKNRIKISSEVEAAERSLQRRYGKPLSMDYFVSLFKQGKTLFIKTQWTEINKDIPLYLLRYRNVNSKNSHHSIICLLAEVRVLSSRRKLYRKWMNSSAKACFKEQLLMIKNALRYYQSGFDRLIFIDSTRDYKIVSYNNIDKYLKYAY